MAHPAPPRTMTVHGLRFLERLAAKCDSGVILEVGPLFGSSTNALAEGRLPGTTIHTIDTFENAPWVTKVTGEELSREAFDRFTAHIDQLVVHQGYSPGVVKDTWSETIGLYFDDATHENPNWLENFDFFSQFFSDDAIMCGDDFSDPWPDIVANVYELKRRYECELFVIGRVWALSRTRSERIEDAVDEVFPDLRETTITVTRGGTVRTSKAAVWSDGLHTQAPIDSFSIDGGTLDGEIVTYSGDREAARVPVGSGPVELTGVDGIQMETRQRARIQYCCVNDTGHTANTANFGPSGIFRPGAGEHIVALRLST